MARNFSFGRSPSVSMADFNERAKRIAATTAAVEPAAPRRPPPARLRRDVNGGIPAVPKKVEAPGEEK